MDIRTTGNEDQELEYPLDVIEFKSHTVDGIYLPKKFSAENVRSALSYRARDGDIVIATYPKSGTTWTQYIVCNLLYFDQYGEDSKQPSPMKECPFIERAGLENLKEGGAHKTHLPFDAKRFNPRAKYIVVMRNPRDVCVSYYHHYTNMNLEATDKPKDFWFPTFAKMFISNRVWFGDYFEHVFGWLEGPWNTGANEDNLLYVTYEKMKAHPREELIRIAKFIGGKAAELVKDEKVVDELLRRTSLNTMREQINPHMTQMIRSKLTPDEAKLVPDIEFIRKGEVGDWKNYFSRAISSAFDTWIESKPEYEKVMKLFEV